MTVVYKKDVIDISEVAFYSGLGQNVENLGVFQKL